jgi:hypothetical protein
MRPPTSRWSTAHARSSPRACSSRASSGSRTPRRASARRALRPTRAIRCDLASILFEQGQDPEAQALDEEALADASAPTAVREAAVQLRAQIAERVGWCASTSTAGPWAAPSRSTGLVWTTSPLGTYTAVVSGMLGTSAVTSRRAVFQFVRGQTLVLHVTLVERCITMSCPAGQTCGENGCRSETIAPGELEPYGGSIARRDGGVGPRDAGPDAMGLDAFTTLVDAFVPPDAFTTPDAFAPPEAWLPDGCIGGGLETRNFRDDDCDMNVDETFDLTTDVDDCGVCGRACSFPNGTAACRGGLCELAGCMPGFDDCNGNHSDGCEANLRTNDFHCGMCGNRCRGGRNCCDSMGASSCP